MVTATKKYSRPNESTIMLDRETIARFREAAGDMPLAVWLRELSMGFEGKVAAPYFPLMAKVEQILDEHNAVMDLLKYIKESKTPASASTKKYVVEIGGDSEVEEEPTTTVVEVESEEELKAVIAKLNQTERPGPSWEEEMLAQYDKEHPENEPADYGFYHRDAPGKWHFVEERAKKAYKRVDAEKDAIGAYYEALALKRIKPIPEIMPREYLGDSDDVFGKRLMVHAQHRQLIIKAGFKLLAEEKKRRASKKQKK